MKTKTLMTMAVAGAFGLSTAAFAGYGVITPSQMSEAGENIVQNQKGFHNSYEQSAVGSTSDATSAWLSSASDDASLSMDESIALADEGIYSDFYVVSFTPVVLESWDLYVIDVGEPGELAAADEFSMSPTHELALISSDDGMSYELALVPTDDLSSDESVG